MRDNDARLDHRMLETMRERVVRQVQEIAASAIAASAPEPDIFKPGRDFSAWLGSTLRQNSSGGKEKPGSITKQGNRTIRRLRVPGGAIAASDCGGATSLVRA